MKKYIFLLLSVFCSQKLEDISKPFNEISEEMEHVPNKLDEALAKKRLEDACNAAKERFEKEGKEFRISFPELLQYREQAIATCLIYALEQSEEASNKCSESVDDFLISKLKSDVIDFNLEIKINNAENSLPGTDV